MPSEAPPWHSVPTMHALAKISAGRARAAETADHQSITSYVGALDLRMEDRGPPEPRAVTDLRRRQLSAAAQHGENRDLVLRMCLVDTGEAARIAELSAASTICNLTARRFTPEEVSALCVEPEQLTLSIEVADRHRDHGIIGAVFTRRFGGELFIDALFLASAVQERGIEQAVLSTLLRHAQWLQVTAVIGEYRRSPTNDRYRDLYPQMGFDVVRDDQERRVLRHSLDAVATVPGHILVREEF